jgi:hypothetical protein
VPVLKELIIPKHFVMQEVFPIAESSHITPAIAHENYRKTIFLNDVQGSVVIIGIILVPAPMQIRDIVIKNNMILPVYIK